MPKNDGKQATLKPLSIKPPEQLVEDLKSQRQGPKPLAPKLLPRPVTEEQGHKVSRVYPSLQEYKRTTEKALSLFQFTGEDPRSNVFALIDGVPGYYYSRRMPTPAPGRTEVEPIERPFDFEKQLYVFTMHPVWVRAGVDESGAKAWRQAFPGEREEFVFEGLKRLASLKNIELLDGDLGLTFTLKELQDLLKTTNHTYSLAQIKESINTLCQAVFEIADAQGNTIILDHRLSAAAFNTPGEKSQCYVRFSPFMTQAVRSVKYKAVDWFVLMSLESVLARRLYERMCLFFRQAQYNTTYTVAASSVFRNAGVTACGAPSRWAREVQAALDILIEKKQVRSYTKRKCTDESGNTVDYTFEIVPAFNLISLIATDNSRLKENREKLGINSDQAAGE